MQNQARQAYQTMFLRSMAQRSHVLVTLMAPSPPVSQKNQNHCLLAKPNNDPVCCYCGGSPCVPMFLLPLLLLLAVITTTAAAAVTPTPALSDMLPCNLSCFAHVSLHPAVSPCVFQ